MSEPDGVVTQSELIERSSGILHECSAVCLQLQDVLSPMVASDTHLSGEAVIQMQALDRMSQQLDDLARLLTECSGNFDERPAAFERVVATTTKLNETREKIFGRAPQKADTTPADDVDLF